MFGVAFHISFLLFLLVLLERVLLIRYGWDVGCGMYRMVLTFFRGPWGGWGRAFPRTITASPCGMCRQLYVCFFFLVNLCGPFSGVCSSVWSISLREMDGKWWS